MERLPSWEQIRANFLEAATAYPDVSARWEPRQELWTLRDAPVGEAEKSAKREAQQFFAEAARIAITLLGVSSEEKQAWQVWLDLMRQEKGYFRRDKTPSDWVGSKEILKSEGTVDRSTVPLDGDGAIAKVFVHSADFCTDLAARAIGPNPAPCQAQTDDPNGPEHPAGGATQPPLETKPSRRPLALEDRKRIQAKRWNARRDLENLLAAYDQEYPAVVTAGSSPNGRPAYERGPQDLDRLFGSYESYAVTMYHHLSMEGQLPVALEVLREVLEACKKVPPTHPELIGDRGFQKRIYDAITGLSPVAAKAEAVGSEDVTARQDRNPSYTVRIDPTPAQQQPEKRPGTTAGDSDLAASPAERAIGGQGPTQVPEAERPGTTGGDSDLGAPSTEPPKEMPGTTTPPRDAVPPSVEANDFHPGPASGRGSQPDQEPGASSEPLPSSELRAAKRRGRRPDQKRRESIRSAIEKHGDEWREHLPEILEDLRSNDVALGDFHGMKIDIGDNQNITVSNWDDLGLAEGQEWRRIIDVLRKYAG